MTFSFSESRGLASTRPLQERHSTIYFLAVDCRLSGPKVMNRYPPGDVLSEQDSGRSIVSVAGEDTRLPSLKQHLGAVAIMFDWRLIDRGGELRLDEPEPCRKH